MSEEENERETYSNTQRRATKEGIEYSYGGSRLTTNKSIAEVSPVGKLNPVEVYATENAKIMVNKDDNVIRAAIADGRLKLPPGTKYTGNKAEDGSVLQGSYARKYTLSANAPVQPGDVIQITDESDQHYGLRAIVHRVRSTGNWQVSCHIMSGPHQMTKWVYEGTQYAFVKRSGALEADDYIFTGLDRSRKYIREDSE
jgi:hypothetical protein